MSTGHKTFIKFNYHRFLRQLFIFLFLSHKVHISAAFTPNCIKLKTKSHTSIYVISYQKFQSIVIKWTSPLPHCFLYKFIYFKMIKITLTDNHLHNKFTVKTTSLCWLVVTHLIGSDGDIVSVIYKMSHPNFLRRQCLTDIHK